MKNRHAWALGAFLFGALALSSCGSTASLATLTVTFYGGYGSIGGADSSEASVVYGSTVEAPTNVGRAGYTLISWCDDYDSNKKNGTGTAYDFSASVTANFTLYAKWAAKEAAGHTQEEIDAYMAGLKTTSEKDHLYVHYFRFGNDSASYSDWDVWCWPYKPTSGEGMRFDWDGRTQNSASPTYEASGTSEVDDFGGAVCDIDLTASYKGGWDADAKKMGGQTVDYHQSGGELDTQIGFQIVKSASRTSSSGFWANDGGNQYLDLASYVVKNSQDEDSYHVFYLQDQGTGQHSATPYSTAKDPFADDDGTNVTYGNNSYNTADWSNKAIQATSPEFLKGSSGGAEDSHLENGAGVGYQIMVSSFADSDGDGFGDIYGIEKKLDYLDNLGVNVLWLTPIQKSDSYHGYDITDYNVVDPKYGSSASPAGLANDGLVSEETALADYSSLLTAAHEKGMTVIMDLVLNHTSTGNTWFTQSASLDDEYRAFYQWANHETQGVSENSYWYPYGDHVYSYYAKFGSSMPELNYMYAPTREAVEDMAKGWCALGVDGFRLDAVKHIFLKDEIGSLTSGDTIIKDVSSAGDYSSDLTKNLNFFRELNYEVKKSYPNCFFVGENFDGHAYHVAPYYQGFDSMFDFYSYFNITSMAAYGRGMSGAKVTASGWMQSSGAYTTGSDSSLTNGSDNIMSTANGSAWNAVDVFKTYNKYRSGSSSTTSGSAIVGAFTSNHDIARVINRIHFSGTDPNGISAQGNVTSSDYASYEKSADCAKIAEILFPGCTWIYYGDEIGMTGNFNSGITANSDYSDLAYRQPMKWKQDGAVGDDSYTCSYAVTGSGKKVAWDEINASSAVAGADEQAASSTSEYSKIATFAKLKNSSATLIRGSFEDDGSTTYELKFKRSLGSETYHIAVNFQSQTAKVYNGSTLVASY